MTYAKTIKAAMTALLLGSMMSPAVLADHHGGAIEAAIMSEGRSSEDKMRDEDRKPAAVLKFAGVKPSMTVVDLNSGGGWYTEILSRVVGPKGTVYAHNGPLYWGFVKDRVGERYENRLPNVKLLHRSEEVDAPEGSVDLVFSALAYHDYFFTPKKRPEFADYKAALASIYKALKPGGSFVVVDHVAPAGTGVTYGNTLHRIDPEIVKEQILAAGFKRAETSDILSHPEDDYTKGVFDPEIRGKTDRFIFKFIK